MAEFHDINSSQFHEKTELVGDEKIQISATEYARLQQIANLFKMPERIDAYTFQGAEPSGFCKRINLGSSIEASQEAITVTLVLLTQAYSSEIHSESYSKFSSAHFVGQVNIYEETGHEVGSMMVQCSGNYKEYPPTYQILTNIVESPSYYPYGFIMATYKNIPYIGLYIAGISGIQDYVAFGDWTEIDEFKPRIISMTEANPDPDLDMESVEMLTAEPTMVVSVAQADSAKKLSSSVNIWGNYFDGSRDISGSMVNVGSIDADGPIRVEPTTGEAVIRVISPTDNYSYLRLRSGNNHWDLAVKDTINNSLAFRSSATEPSDVMVMVPGVGVGIKKTPEYALDVAGEIRIRSTSFNKIIFQNSDTHYLTLLQDGANLRINNYSKITDDRWSLFTTEQIASFQPSLLPIGSSRRPIYIDEGGNFKVTTLRGFMELKSSIVEGGNIYYNDAIETITGYNSQSFTGEQYAPNSSDRTLYEPLDSTIISTKKLKFTNTDKDDVNNKFFFKRTPGSSNLAIDDLPVGYIYIYHLTGFDSGISTWVTVTGESFDYQMV